MPVDETLARVEEDLLAGRVALARQRLRSLVGTYPQRLDLRERLAAVYRIQGESAQAGRWSYLSATREPEEVAAFERLYRDPIRIMKALSWRADEADASTDLARERLRTLRARAEKEFGAPLDWKQLPYPGRRRRWWDPVVELFVVAVALGLLALVVLGIGSLAARGFDVLLGWFD